jgi:hypothetical protein
MRLFLGSLLLGLSILAACAVSSPVQASESLSQPQAANISSSQWLAWASKGWRYFQPGVGVDQNTGLSSAGYGYHYFTEWDLGTYIFAILDAEQLGIVPVSGTWGSTYRFNKIMDFISLRQLTSNNVAYLWYDATTGSPAFSGETNAADLGFLLNAMYHLKQQHPEYGSTIDRIFAPGGRENIAYFASNPNLWGGSNVYVWLTAHGFKFFGYDTYPGVANALRILQNILTGPQVSTYGISLPKADLTSEPLLLAAFTLPAETGFAGLLLNVALAQQNRKLATGKFTGFSEGNAENLYTYEWIVQSNGATWSTVPAVTPVAYIKVAFGFYALYGLQYYKDLLNFVNASFTGYDYAYGYWDGVNESGNVQGTLIDRTQGILLAAARYAVVSLGSTAQAMVSGTLLTTVPVSGAASSGPHGDQSTLSTAFTSSSETLTVTGNGVQQYLMLATSQLWDSSSTVGASMGICRDGYLISGDMFSLGATPVHRHLASALALDTPSTGSHTYSLCYKTDPGSAAFVSGTFLIAVPVSGASSSGPGHDQSTTSTTFTPSAQSILIKQPGIQQYLLLAVSQVWDGLGTIGASMAVCRDGLLISGDMYNVGATLGHRNLATAIALDIPSAGTHSYSLCFKTDAGGIGFVSGTLLIAVPVSSASSDGPDGDQSASSIVFQSSLESVGVTGTGSQQYLVMATSQLWDSYTSIGASIGICEDGLPISGDMYSVGATQTHRHLGTAISLSTPSGSHTYSLCYKTDPGTGP